VTAEAFGQMTDGERRPRLIIKNPNKCLVAKGTLGGPNLLLLASTQRAAALMDPDPKDKSQNDIPEMEPPPVPDRLKPVRGSQ
jgi:hypothetical protein